MIIVKRAPGFSTRCRSKHGLARRRNWPLLLSTLKLAETFRHFACGNCKWISLNYNICFPISISIKFAPMVDIYQKRVALIQLMALCRTAVTSKKFESYMTPGTKFACIRRLSPWRNIKTTLTCDINTGFIPYISYDNSLMLATLSYNALHVLMVHY